MPDPTVNHRVPVRGIAQGCPRRSAAAYGPQRPHALSAPGHVGMGSGTDRKSNHPARAELPIVNCMAAARRTQRRRSRPCDNRHEHQRSEVTMNVHLKVQSHHLERGAYLYIRQSSMRQVVENVESARRQYALRGRAVALGWRDEQIIVIDNDQGESGASAVWREGFQRLVSDVGMGHAGIVMGLEVSRLARNNADWQRLLEICALACTLILDEDGVYDPASFNDRLLLGLKGTMSEAELHVIKARLRGGILNKVRRGEFRCLLPTGLVYDHSGNVALDPDMQVRETIVHFFETFSRVGSASQTVKVFRNEGLLFPSRLHNSETVFRPLTASTARRLCVRATLMTGRPACPMPTPVISVGSDTRRT
ncbi:recombinase family protein (plasmid) [Rhizobium leguminosarum]|uniref:Recombinase family protein n=2 Tax=Rhizobium leguminosarum TaxID=384 RepID=A0ACD5FHA9_RHILE